jgi:hypothetical protein
MVYSVRIYPHGRPYGTAPTRQRPHTAAGRRAIHPRRERIAALAEREAFPSHTVAQGKKRSCGQDAPMGPKPPRSTGLTKEEDALMVGCRQYTLLPLDDCRAALQATLPPLTRSALHRLPEVAGDTPKPQQGRRYPSGAFPLAIAEGRTAAGKRCLFVAIDRTSTLASAALHPSAT